MLREVVRAAVEMDQAERAVADAVVLVERHRLAGELEGMVEQAVRRRRGRVPIRRHVDRQQGIGAGVAGVELDGLLVERARLGSGRRVVERQGVGAQHAFIGREAGRRLAAWRVRRRRAWTRPASVSTMVRTSWSCTAKMSFWSRSNVPAHRWLAR